MQRTKKKVQLAGRLRFFLNNWQKITGNPAILETKNDYSTGFLENPYQKKKTPYAKLNVKREISVEKEMNK